MGAACSYSLAPGKSIARYCWRKLSSNRGWLFLSFFFLIILRPVIINYSSFNLTSQLPTVVTLMKFSRQCSDLKNHYIASTQTPSVFCLSAKDVSPSSQESYQVRNQDVSTHGIHTQYGYDCNTQIQYKEVSIPFYILFSLRHHVNDVQMIALLPRIHHTVPDDFQHCLC